MDHSQTCPVAMTAENNAGQEVWELCNVIEDPTELHDLARSQPAKLKELQGVFEREAKKNQVYPLINWAYLFPGFMDFQKKMELLSGASSPTK